MRAMAVLRNGEKELCSLDDYDCHRKSICQIFISTRDAWPIYIELNGRF